jgi:hypothetical protein
MSNTHKARKFSQAYVDILCPENASQSIKDKARATFEIGFIAGMEAARGVSLEAVKAAFEDMKPKSIIMPKLTLAGAKLEPGVK